jgi:hypothetical protein
MTALNLDGDMTALIILVSAGISFLFLWLLFPKD